MPSAADLTRAFAESVVRRLRDAGHQALFAGGCVRDLLLGSVPQDFDVATTARPDEVRHLFGHRRTLAVGASFGVIVVVPSKAEREAGVVPVEVATFRTEGPYIDGRRPEHVSFADAEADAKRRDFTVNGMFLDPLDDRVIDFVGGQQDLAARVIRAIGEPRERMAEDKLRLLRAIRFAATLGFELDEETRSAVREMAGQLTVVSAERISAELRRMLMHATRRRAVELCADCGLLEVIFPELTPVLRLGKLGEHSPWERTLRALDVLDRPRFESSLAILLHSMTGRDDAPSMDEHCRRLRLSNNDRETAVWLLEHRHDLDAIRHRSHWFLKRLCAHPDIIDLISTVRALRTAAGESRADVEHVERFLAETPRHVIDPPPLLDGGDLVALGLKPGPEFKRLLDAVRNAQLDGTIDTDEAAIDFARRLHAEGVADTKDRP
ncbi:MAG: CCA tRNA nucleotidyltransferase [Planctomycetota bacterium]|nr:CCA tRNA nucleotidyltransferase [Planctomycetota bacterium]